ncbi:venom carboxylesterase-6-like [Zerene cesonia]|uniref:venom carboxylesterase-6-like n=1 Tax=Zerene cesonia TaxID=33412 RepID=UPI0018E597D9|nr:venom carboxylesterase-6-like [Zerene cesonia]
MWSPVSLVLLFVLAVCTSGEEAARPEVRTPLGPLRGFHMSTRRGRRISAFTGVPYAEPPVGELRFKAPVAVRAWGERVRDASGAAPACVQRNPYTRERSVRGQEDCLYLNVYTPLATARLLPVMVWLHGGGWMCGDSSTAMYGPEFLLDREVLLVTLNYRLGPLGFLSTQDEACPGNNGLKDQQEALRFIQKTIHSFGGDNSSVTIFGESAGGASVHFHMLSETSAGLFHKAISQSGTALVPWAEAAPGEALRQAWRLARLLRCPQAPSWRMLHCLRSRDSYDIIATEFSFYEWDYEPMTPFKAVVEGETGEEAPFLQRAARAPRAASSVPWLTGLNKDEGCLKSVWITSNRTLYEQFMSGFERIGPLSLYYESSPLAPLITRRLRERYLPTRDEQLSKAGILEMYSDAYFSFPLREAARRAVAAGSRVYLYELAHRAANSFSQIFGDPNGDYGVCHADDLMHLFPIHFLSKPASAQDEEISELMLTLWTNFATSGDPNGPVSLPFEWAAAGSELQYLRIAARPAMHARLAHRARLWERLPLWHTFQRDDDEPPQHTPRDDL